ncbi:myo-inositol-1(or 4)-monophosphatase [Streptococcus rupicaprae]|uniref:Myo-inositol-1(Or 4)-monophosphatase n=1 Tax=Streptococcus rupicaprae TaxID=759619 RepID=A0ABV2FHH0_9STRE
MEAKFDFAKSLVCSAGEYLKAGMDQPLAITEKTDFTDLVTDMDRKVQDFLISEILSQYPADHFLAEEEDYKQPIDKGAVWVIDPIDGTNNFVAQKCDFAISLAYFEDGVGQFGLIYDVMAEQLFYGGGQFDVFCNDQPLPAYQAKRLSKSLLAINPGMYRHNIQGLAGLADQVLGIRTYGSAAISMAKVLSGQLLGYISHISPWDYAAAKVMGERLGYVTIGLVEELNFQDRQYVMMVPACQLDVITEILEHSQ